ncbi:MAG: hypothetical protein RL119_462 [Actinomycetota bacterium]
MEAVNAADLNRHVAGAAAAHQRLLGLLQPGDESDSGGLTDEMVARDSLLPGWTVGHVLAHLVHNADSLVRLFKAAEVGEIADQYPGGAAQRNTDIERDASARASEHIDRLRRSLYGLESTWFEAKEAWVGHGRNPAGVLVPIAEVPLRRWREVEVHSGDLGLAELACSGSKCWSDEYIRYDCSFLTMQYKARGSMGLNDLPDAVRTAEPRYRLAWLLGRHIFDGVAPAGLMT